MTTTDYDPNVVLSTENDFKVVGTRPVRHDGVDKVTGRAIYGADYDASGLLHGKILRSPHAHAKIISIDTSKAEALDGVHAVVTAKDFPETADKTMELGEDETRKLCSEIIEKTGASSIKDMGKVMGELKKNHSDDIDFSKAGAILKEILNK